MIDAEYRRLTTLQMTAINDWMLAGGQLVVLCQDDVGVNQLLDEVQPNVPTVNFGRRVGLGGVTAVRSEECASNARFSTSIDLDGKDSAALLMRLREESGGSKKLKADLGPLSRVSWFIFAFLLLFGLLVGPVNLFVFANAGRRHRLFWTTPLLSLGACIGLAIFMLVKDGVGGAGSRLTLAVMDPTAKRLAIRQEQFCKTGVMFGTSFQMKEPALMQVAHDDKIKFDDRELTLEENGNQRSGPWFRSRSIDGHTLQAVRPTRGAITVALDASGMPASVVSSFDVSLSRVVLVGRECTMWMATNLRPGERKSLARTTTFIDWAKTKWDQDSLQGLGGASIESAYTLVTKSQLGLAIAEVAPQDASKLAIGTLDSIRWTKDHAVLVGPYLTESTPNQP
jgi:hypothetical protein